MQKYVTVSAKIPAKLRERMRRLKIMPSRIFHKAIEEELKAKETKNLKAGAKKLRKLFAKISTEEAVRSIREDRDSR